MVDHWKYFLILEKEVIDALEYVELSHKNHDTFSNRFNKILLSIGSEVDVTMKVLCIKFGAPQKTSNIDSYRSDIMKIRPSFSNIEIEILNYGKIRPWESWLNNINPTWWRDYNDLKHERDAYFEKGNLENIIQSLGGLYSVLLYLYESEISSLAFSQYPVLYKYPGAEPENIIAESFLKLP